MIRWQGGIEMATILVDYENTFASNGLKGVDVLSPDDTLIIFYSNSCRKIRLFFASPKYLKLQNAFPKVAAGNSSFLHVSPA